jgi:hypothetical protein
MTRFVLLAIALALPYLVDEAVDCFFKQVHESKGYTDGQVAGMKRLLDRELVRKPVKAKQHMSGAEQAVALKYLWGDEK